MTGRHRDPDPATGPLRISRPSRQQLIDRTDPWDGPERRHLTRTDDRPATGWDQAAVPATDEPDEDQTVRFSLADLAAHTGAHLIPTDLVSWLAEPEPDATGPLPCWHTGEMRTIPEPRPAPEPSRWWALVGLLAAVAALAAAALCLALAPGGA